MIELSTPKELILDLKVLIEDERKYQRIKQKDLSLKAGIPFPTYKEFLYNHKLSLENLFKILITLGMFENIRDLLKRREIQTLQEKKESSNLPKRIK